MKNINYMICAVLIAASTSFAEMAIYNLAGIPDGMDEITLNNGDQITGTVNGSEVKCRILVAKDAKITLQNAQVLGANNGYESAGITCLGNCTIVLKGRNVMRGYDQNFPGVQVANDENDQKYTLTIQGDGSLEASSSGKGAGIGCKDNTNCGHIVIKSGVIKATGGLGSAGIGSSAFAHGGNISIEGGRIVAMGGEDAAGIGGGASGSVGNIKISGGDIIALGGSNAAGIGSGYISKCGNIEITNDVVKVVATKAGEAPHSIGMGLNGEVGTVTIGDAVGVVSENPLMFHANSYEIVTAGNNREFAFFDGDYSGDVALDFTYDMTVDTVIFKRMFPALEGEDNYSTIMFPFEINPLEVGNLREVFSFLGIGVDNNNNKYVAVQELWCDRCDYYNDTTTLEAYKPYLITLDPEATSISINKSPIVIKKIPSEFDVKPSEKYSQYGNYVFRGVVKAKTWGANDEEILGTNKAAAYGFAGSSTTDISVGQFVRLAEGAYIKPFRAYIYKSPVQSVNVNNGSSLRPIASIDDDLPEVMNIVVVDGKKEGEEHTTVIGQFNSRTGEFLLNRTPRSYDLKGRSVRDASRKAKGMYLKK